MFTGNSFPKTAAEYNQQKLVLASSVSPQTISHVFKYCIFFNNRRSCLLCFARLFLVADIDSTTFSSGHGFSRMIKPLHNMFIVGENLWIPSFIQHMGGIKYFRS